MSARDARCSAEFDQSDNLKMVSSGNLRFRVNPRLLRLLGDQLIRDANLVVFELVKNAYDADPAQCTVSL